MVDSVPMLRVVRRLRDLVRQWWDLEILFVDKQFNLQGAGDSQPSSICRIVQSTEAGRQRCLTAEKALGEMARSYKRPDKVAGHYSVGSVCFAGMERTAIPVYVEGELQGSVLAVGYRTDFPTLEECRAVVAELEPLGISEETLYREWEQLRLLDQRDAGYLRALLKLVVDEILIYEEEACEQNRRAREGLQSASRDAGAVVGGSPVMRELLSMVSSVAPSEATVLITGESGSGKEVVAKTLHQQSARAEKPFIAQNCGAFHENLLESELFGYVKGAFTGANADKRGLLEAADGGTFFLDEIGEMSFPMQVKLLRVLQEGVFFPVGSPQPRHVDVRVVAATHRPLEDMVENGAFREDLFYRLNVIRLEVPPLRERREDILPLVDHFLESAASSARVQEKKLHPVAKKLLHDYDWPGNVRELQNEIQRLVVLSGDAAVVAPTLLSERIRERKRARSRLNAGESLDEAISRFESEVIVEGLKRTRFNKSRLARELGMSRTSLLHKIQKYGLERRRKRRRQAA